MEPIAWIGGTSPRPFRYVSIAEEMYTFELFWDQCNVFRDYWGEGPDGDVAEIFWGRARYDAHATFRVENHKSVLASGSRLGESKW